MNTGATSNKKYIIAIAVIAIISILVFLFFQGFNGCIIQNELPKCIIFWNENQRVLKDMFVESMQLHMPKMEVVPFEFKTKVSSSNFGTLEFKELMKEKIHTIQDYILEHDGETVLVSDIDILVYKPFTELMCLNEVDIVFQKEERSHGINTGFYLMKCSTRTYDFWKQVEIKMKLTDREKFINEQRVVNTIIDSSGLKWSVFPDTIWAFSNKPMPDNIYLHHANVTRADETKSSLEKKIDQILNIMSKTGYPYIERFRRILTIPRLPTSD